MYVLTSAALCGCSHRMSADLDAPPSHPPTVYDLIANVTHESAAGTTRDKESTVWKVHLRAGAGGGEHEKWFQIQDLIVEEIRKEMIVLGETVLQVRSPAVCYTAYLRLLHRYGNGDQTVHRPIVWRSTNSISPRVPRVMLVAFTGIRKFTVVCIWTVDGHVPGLVPPRVSHVSMLSSLPIARASFCNTARVHGVRVCIALSHGSRRGALRGCRWLNRPCRHVVASANAACCRPVAVCELQPSNSDFLRPVG